MTGRSDPDDTVIEEALAWLEATRRDDADWDAYTIWLETDPRHRQTIHELSLIESAYTDHKDELRPQAPLITPPANRSRRWGWIGGGLAAALVAAVGIPMLSRPQADTVYVTETGQHRLVRLSGGTVVNLGPSTRLLAKAGNPDDLLLAQGEAFFTVPHKPDRTLSIDAGHTTVSDIGTTFEINRAREIVKVAVADGYVTVGQSNASPVRLGAGQQLIANSAKATQTTSHIIREQIGSWRNGRLVYSDTPLAIVVADITRYSGIRVSIDPELENRTFSGVLVVEDGSKMLANLADVMAIANIQAGDHNYLQPAGRR